MAGGRRRAGMMLVPRIVYVLGAALGWAMYLGSRSYRRHLRENLAGAGVHDPAVRRAAVASAGRMVLELPVLWLLPRAQIVSWVRRIEGEAAVDAARALGKGIVFLTPHHGCFEITAQVAATRLPITVLYRPPKLRWLQPLLERGRGGDNVHLAPADLAGVRALLSALRRGEAVGILPDQVPSRGEGVWAPFFGRPAYTMTLAMRLAARPGTAAFLAYGERLAGGRGYAIHLEPLPGPRAGEDDGERRLNRALEAMVLRHPGQYLWGYNRYKAPRGVEPPAPDGTAGV